MRHVSLRFGIGLFFCCLLPSVASAHNQGSSYGQVEFTGIGPSELQLELSPLDLLQELDLDGDADARLTWGEVLEHRAAIYATAEQGVRISAGGDTCRATPAANGLALVRRSEQMWIRVSLGIDCPTTPESGAYRFDYDMFFGSDPSHRLLLRVSGSSGESAWVLSAANHSASITPAPSLAKRAAGFVLEGFRHILSGYDHLAFLLLLVLPLAGRDHLRERLWRIGGIVTAFTVAHSVTLAAAILGFVRVPAQPVEIAIAASVVLAAILNVVRPGHAWGWQAALGFGLLHGFGFAGALAGLNLEGVAVWAALAGFNAGIELGQMLVVLLTLPILTLLSQWPRYRPVVVPATSLAFAALGTLWIVSRI